ncbi:hypothetical protein SKAU_G00337510 [Synaphobranchus kaupii]|uniref:Uncharacterized protein n=1 Tax=Synaphobranchus kaupii TaxID=118154 RepID=A0A9Q1II70_SYNKA|nr:hypothetical protein SKAU_G00337510 [Synaphobranchus kaupii]
MAEGGEGEDEIQFLRTDDEVVLQCVASIQKENRKFCLTAEGLEIDCVTWSPRQRQRGSEERGRRDAIFTERRAGRPGLPVCVLKQPAAFRHAPVNLSPVRGPGGFEDTLFPALAARSDPDAPSR